MFILEFLTRDANGKKLPDQNIFFFGMKDLNQLRSGFCVGFLLDIRFDIFSTMSKKYLKNNGR